jgi:hypothetical protein
MGIELAVSWLQPVRVGLVLKPALSLLTLGAQSKAPLSASRDLARAKLPFHKRSHLAALSCSGHVAP